MWSVVQLPFFERSWSRANRNFGSSTLALIFRGSEEINTHTFRAWWLVGACFVVRCCRLDVANVVIKRFGVYATRGSWERVFSVSTSAVSAVGESGESSKSTKL